MCWRKLSCLFEVVAQKSSRLMVSVSEETRPSSPMIVMEDFLPNGGLASTRSTFSRRLLQQRVLDLDRRGRVDVGTTDAVEEEVHRA